MAVSHPNGLVTRRDIECELSIGSTHAQLGSPEQDIDPRFRPQLFSPMLVGEKILYG